MGGLLADWQIRARTKLPKGDESCVVIEPFSEAVKVPKQVVNGITIPGKVSWGLSSYGYDIRAGRNFLVFSDIAATVIDPTTMADTVPQLIAEGRFAHFADVDACIIPPNSFALAESLEYVEIPRDCLVIVLGKSTYARCGTNLNMTPLEPEWRGKITVEIINATRLPLRIHAGQGIGQMLFLLGDAMCEQSYEDKRLKGLASYQDQKGLTLPTA